MARGRAVYNARCYFCHGYDGDAATVAAAMLDPRPRDFTAGPPLDRARILDALRNGRPGSAMQPFSGLLTKDEIADVAEFVSASFVACAAPNTAYHTAANGWPRHALRYGSAYPFVTGELPVDAEPQSLAPDRRIGLELFRSACVSCHEGRIAVPTPLALSASPTGSESGLWRGRVTEHDPYGTPTLHDRSPDIPDLTPSEAEGGRLYLLACAECHAADGTGQNWVGRFLTRSPPDFTDPAFARRFTVDRFAAATLTPPPGTAMPDFASALTPAEARMIADYVRRAFTDAGKEHLPARRAFSSPSASTARPAAVREGWWPESGTP